MPLRSEWHVPGYPGCEASIDLLDRLPVLRRFGFIMSRPTDVSNTSRSVGVTVCQTLAPSTLALPASSAPLLASILCDKLGLPKTTQQLWEHALGVLSVIPLDHPFGGTCPISSGDCASRVEQVARSSSLDGDLLPLFALCLGRQICVYDLREVRQLVTTEIALPIRRYGPDTTYFAPLCLAWDGTLFCWLQISPEDGPQPTPSQWEDAVWRERLSRWKVPWFSCLHCGLLGCHDGSSCPTSVTSKSPFKSFQQTLRRRVSQFYGVAKQ